MKHFSQRPLTQGLAAVDRLEEQELFLKVRREIRQVENLREPRSSEAEPPCGFGLILNLAAEDRLPDLVGKGQCDGDAGGAVHGLGDDDGNESLLSSVPDPMELAVYDSSCLAHSRKHLVSYVVAICRKPVAVVQR